MGLISFHHLTQKVQPIHNMNTPYQNLHNLLRFLPEISLPFHVGRTKPMTAARHRTYTLVIIAAFVFIAAMLFI